MFNVVWVAIAGAEVSVCCSVTRVARLSQILLPLYSTAVSKWLTLSQCMVCGREKGMTENAFGSDQWLIRLDIGCQIVKNQIACTNDKMTSSYQPK